MYAQEALTNHDAWAHRHPATEDTRNSILGDIQSIKAAIDRLASLAAPEQAQPVARDREADRARFPDLAFNRWLDEAITDNGEFSVWHQIGDTCAAWHGWENRQFYATPPQAPQAAPEAVPQGDEQAQKLALAQRIVERLSDSPKSLIDQLRRLLEMPEWDHETQQPRAALSTPAKD